MSGARAVWAAACAAYAGVLLWSAGRLPERVASHFGAGGAADGWSSRGEHLLFIGLLGVGMLAGLPLLAAVLSRGSGTFINVPHKDYWLDDAHPNRRREFRRRFTDDVLTVAALTGALLTWMQVETVLANESDPPRMGASMWVALVVFMVLMLGWTAWLLTSRYRPPAEEPGSGDDGPILPTR